MQMKVSQSKNKHLETTQISLFLPLAAEITCIDGFRSEDAQQGSFVGQHDQIDQDAPSVIHVKQKTYQFDIHHVGLL